MRNHQTSIKNIETQLAQLTTPVNERLPPKNQEPKSQPHVMAIYTGEEVHSDPITTHEVAIIQPKSCLEQEKPDAKREKSEVFSNASPRWGDLTISWS